MKIEESKKVQRKIKTEIEMLVENMILTRQFVDVEWIYKRHVNLRGYEGVTYSNSYYNNTNKYLQTIILNYS